MLDMVTYGINFIWKDSLIVKDIIYVSMLVGLVYVNVVTMREKDKRTILLVGIFIFNALTLCRILPLISFVKVG